MPEGHRPQRYQSTKTLLLTQEISCSIDLKVKHSIMKDNHQWASQT
jgi:hypothetical protein